MLKPSVPSRIRGNWAGYRFNIRYVSRRGKKGRRGRTYIPHVFSRLVTRGCCARGWSEAASALTKCTNAEFCIALGDVRMRGDEISSPVGSNTSLLRRGERHQTYAKNVEEKRGGWESGKEKREEVGAKGKRNKETELVKEMDIFWERRCSLTLYDFETVETTRTTGRLRAVGQCIAHFWRNRSSVIVKIINY